MSPIVRMQSEPCERQPGDSQPPLSVLWQGLPLQHPFETAGMCQVVYFKMLREISYKNAVLLHISRNRKRHILLEPFLHKILLAFLRRQLFLLRV